MDALILALVAIGPGVAWVWFFYRQDRYEPEPRHLIWRTFFFGMLAVLPAAALELPFRTWMRAESGAFGLFAVSFLVVGVVEEGFKFLAARISVGRERAFNEPVDGIVYTVTAALGFAAVENLLYLYSFGLRIAIFRAIVTYLAHASFSGLVGYYWGLSRFGDPSRRGGAVAARGLLAAIALHGLYDFLLLGRLASPIFALLLVYLVYRFVARKIRETRDDSPFRP